MGLQGRLASDRVLVPLSACEHAFQSRKGRRGEREENKLGGGREKSLADSPSPLAPSPLLHFLQKTLNYETTPGKKNVTQLRMIIYRGEEVFHGFVYVNRRVSAEFW